MCFLIYVDFHLVSWRLYLLKDMMWEGSILFDGVDVGQKDIKKQSTAALKGQKKGPDFSIETEAHSKGFSFVAGVDEAGRGPWAGPVVAAAVVFNQHDIPDGLNDSKALSEAQREVLYDQIVACSDWAVGIADVKRIDEMNILHASLWAMARAVEGLNKMPDFVLVDGNKSPELDVATRSIVKGDARSLSIAAASIIAKVTRDRMMQDLDKAFPEYLWAKNKGYGTKAHRDALSLHGICQHHRRSFKPIRELLER